MHSIVQIYYLQHGETNMEGSNINCMWGRGRLDEGALCHHVTVWYLAPVVGVIKVSEYILLLSQSQLLSSAWTAVRIPSQWGMLDAFGHLTAVDPEYVDATIKKKWEWSSLQGHLDICKTDSLYMIH